MASRKALLDRILAEAKASAPIVVDDSDHKIVVFQKKAPGEQVHKDEDGAQPYLQLLPHHVKVYDSMVASDEAVAALAQTEGRQIPRGYQLEGIAWLYGKRRAMLTDQPGLGKTLQAAEAAVRPVLVVCPNYLTRQWYDFLTAQYPNDTVEHAKGNRRKKNASLAKKADWTVVNVQMLRTHELSSDDYCTLIFDESHHLKNRKSQQARAAAILASDMDMRVYELTATPMWKSVDDIWMQLHILQPKIFTSYYQFVSDFCIIDEDAMHNIKILGVKRSMRGELEELLNIVRLGRTYTDVGRHLPRIIQKFVRNELPEDLRKTYDDVRLRYRLDAYDEEEGDFRLIMTSYAEVMHSLRQITAWPGKVQDVIDMLLDETTGEGAKPTVIFTWYTESAELVYNAIKRNKELSDGKKIALISGKHVKDPDERRRLAMDAHITVATIPSLSEGVNLYHCRTVGFFEEHYPPGSNYQALSRVRRDRNDDGANTEPVQVYYFHCVNTIDVKIHSIATRREGTIKELMREVMA